MSSTAWQLSIQIHEPVEAILIQTTKHIYAPIPAFHFFRSPAGKTILIAPY